jgi:histidyl-tRNA synthetase
MKLANRSGAAWALIVGDDERAAGTVTVRDLRGGGDQQAVPRSNLIDHLRGLAADPARTS